jgi:hypothetical protein
LRAAVKNHFITELKKRGEKRIRRFFSDFQVVDLKKSKKLKSAQKNEGFQLAATETLLKLAVRLGNKFLSKTHSH